MENRTQEQVVYQADPQYVQSLKAKKDKLGKALQHCMHRYVRIQTIDGQTFEGTVINVDGLHMYIRLSRPVYDSRAFFYPGGYYYNDVILPLVLFNLLAITLLYT